ncbi:hypothetical protein GIB67_041619 [Kingdonia uniflora]|uniref:Uncharacterized protein n=1 Tax=Kingdonia uniflora TaxID=39325 RepID=A0A7J7MR09_9MAGN|nr:hypothetical protein GIB67_041619 [Kingdonia uniflora]
MNQPQLPLGFVYREPPPSPPPTESEKNLLDYKFSNFDQRLDHFSFTQESYTTFPQRYAVNSNFWRGAKDNYPIFVELAGEWEMGIGTRLLAQHGVEAKALLVIIEHHYYGKSMPLGSREGAMNNATTLGYLSASQALADAATLITELKRNLSAENCPVIVFGGLYAGELAIWFRLKYPHIAMAAWWSSTPIFRSPDLNKVDEYDAIVSRGFREYSESCYQTIKASWDLIDKMAAKPGGPAELSIRFKTCEPLTSVAELKAKMKNKYSDAAQYGSSALNTFCDILQAYERETLPDPCISNAWDLFCDPNPDGSEKVCFNLNEVSPMDRPFSFQVCTEGQDQAADHRSSNETMYKYDDKEKKWDVPGHLISCVDTFNV